MTNWWHNKLNTTSILLQRRHETTEPLISSLKYRGGEMTEQATSFIDGSASRAGFARLFNPRSSNEDPVFPRGLGRHGLPAPDGLRVRASHRAGRSPCRASR